MLMHFSSSPVFPDCEDPCLLILKTSEASPLLRPANISNAVLGKQQLTEEWSEEKMIVELSTKGVGPLSVLRE